MIYYNQENWRKSYAICKDGFIINASSERFESYSDFVEEVKDYNENL